MAQTLSEQIEQIIKAGVTVEDLTKVFSNIQKSTKRPAEAPTVTDELKAKRIKSKGSRELLNVYLGSDVFKVESDVLLRPGSVFAEDYEKGVREWSWPSLSSDSFKVIIGVLSGFETIDAVKSRLDASQRSFLRKAIDRFGFYELIQGSKPGPEMFIKDAVISGSSSAGNMGARTLLTNADNTDYWDNDFNKDNDSPSLRIQFSKSVVPTEITIVMKAVSPYNLFKCTIVSDEESDKEVVHVSKLGDETKHRGMAKIAYGESKETESPNDKKTFTVKIANAKACNTIGLLFAGLVGPVKLKFNFLSIKGCLCDDL